MARPGWLVVAWSLVVMVAAGLTIRWSTPSTTLLAGLAGLSPLLLVPVVALVAATVRAGTQLLRVATVGIVVVYLATFASPRAVLGCGPETADDQITVMTHNVEWRRGRPAELAADVAATGTDVLVLQENWPAFTDELGPHPDVTGLRYRATSSVEGTTGLAIWSRWPVRDAQLQPVGRARVLSAVVEHPSGPLTVVAVHVTAPLGPGGADAWRTELDLLATTLDPSTPTVVAGDFNATVDHQPFRHLLDRGWVDTHHRKGCGFDTTWPTPVSLLRLDHVLVSNHFDVLAVEIGDGNGADHRWVIARIRRPGPGAPADGG